MNEIESPSFCKIGVKYMVPCANNIYGQVVPIILPAHSDSKDDCIDGELKHYHFDERFANFLDSDNNALAFRSVVRVTAEEKICLRESSTRRKPGLFSIDRLSRKHQGFIAAKGYCPHQGTKLINSCGTCPAHGLVFDTKSWRLKYNPPFFLKNGSVEGEIIDSKCTIVAEVSKMDYKYDGYRFTLVDRDGKEYKECYYDLEVKELYNGQKLNFYSDSCSLEEKKDEPRRD